MINLIHRVILIIQVSSKYWQLELLCLKYGSDLFSKPINIFLETNVVISPASNNPNPLCMVNIKNALVKIHVASPAWSLLRFSSRKNCINWLIFLFEKIIQSAAIVTASPERKNESHIFVFQILLKTDDMFLSDHSYFLDRSSNPFGQIKIGN